MAEARIEHIFNCTAETYWDRLFFDADYNDRLFLGALKFPKFQKVSEESTDTEIRRVLDVIPKLGPMPGPLKKLIGDSLGYREEGVFDRKKQQYSLTIIPSKLSNKIDIQGVISTEPAGEGKTKRVFVCKVKAKIFGVGRLVEKQVLGDMDVSYNKAAEFTNKYIAENGL